MRMIRKHRVVNHTLACLAMVLLCAAPVLGQESARTLDEVLGIARQRAPLVLAARARIEEARGRYEGAAVRFQSNPVIETEGGPRISDRGKSADFDVAFPKTRERLLPLDREIVCYCSGFGCEESIELAEKLRLDGFSRIYVFLGGWPEWSEAGLPVLTLDSLNPAGAERRR